MRGTESRLHPGKGTEFRGRSGLLYGRLDRGCGTAGESDRYLAMIY